MIAASLFALAALVGTAAQDGPDVPGEPRDSVWRTKPEPLAVQMVHNYALCAAKRTPAGATSLLAMDFRTPEYRDALRRYARGHGYCAPRTKLKFNGLLFAGGLAEAQLTNIPNYASRLPFTPGSTPFQARDEMEAVGLCLARSAPNETAALIATEPTSEQERVSINAITPRLSGCLAKGQEARFNRPGLRALIALAAYRLATAPTGA